MASLLLGMVQGFWMDLFSCSCDNLFFLLTMVSCFLIFSVFEMFGTFFSAEQSLYAPDRTKKFLGSLLTYLGDDPAVITRVVARAFCSFHRHNINKS